MMVRPLTQDRTHALARQIFLSGGHYLMEEGQYWFVC